MTPNIPNLTQYKKPDIVKILYDHFTNKLTKSDLNNIGEPIYNRNLALVDFEKNNISDGVLLKYFDESFDKAKRFYNKKNARGWDSNGPFRIVLGKKIYYRKQAV